MGDVGKRSAVDDCGSAFESLYQIGVESFFQQYSHCSVGFQIACFDYPFIKGSGNGYVAKTFFKIGEAGRQTEYGHDFAGDGDAEVVFPDNAIGFTSHTDNDIAQRPVVHIQTAFESYSFRIDAERIALLQMVVDKGAEEIVGTGHRMEISGEVQIYIFHRYDLRVAAAGGSAFHSEYRTE